METFFLFLVRQESERALPALAAASQVTLVQNHQNAIVGYPGATCPGPQLYSLDESTYESTSTTELCFI